MQRILYYIFIYNILFEGVFEGKKPPPTSLRRGERKKLSGISNPPILADTKREMPNEEIVRGDSPEKWTDAEGTVGSMNRHNMPDDIWTDADNRGRKRQII